MEEGNILHSLYEQVSESRSKLKLLKEQISGMDSLPMKSIEGCSSSSVKQKVDELMDYESSARTLNKESELLRSGVFEDLSRDEGIHYFLAIAEVQKNIRGLRELKQMGDRILGDNLEHAKLVEDILLERNGVDKRIREEMERSKDDEMNENGASSQLNDEAEKEKTAIKELSTKIRDTHGAYNFIKSELGHFLENINTEEWTSMCFLLQELWNTYVLSRRDPSSEYLRVSHLEFDVSQSDINKLVSEGILLVSPEDPDQIKLIEFKR
eukprot:TRINITY_DN6192_c0_g1_i1.p1 TRINITY_DN6192_c0_g1~~TRINITY_DN6192_c0_g1_i1.p1  ORF type:complete len:268 (+),score=106.42 TRINITY_DN6192_c0_g1_i1:42-845(+)